MDGWYMLPDYVMWSAVAAQTTEEHLTSAAWAERDNICETQSWQDADESADIFAPFAYVLTAALPATVIQAEAVLEAIETTGRVLAEQFGQKLVEVAKLR